MSKAADTEAQRAVTVSAAMVQQKAADLVRSSNGERVLLLRARPQWTGGDVRVGEQPVRVLPGVSQLGILDSIHSLGADEFAVILTDRPRSDLGDSILVRSYKQDIQMPDEWQAVPRLFGAREVSRELRRLDWAATALLDHQPVGGWPITADVAVTEMFALEALVNAVLGLGLTDELDASVLMSALGRREVRTRWARVDDRLRRNLIDWVGSAHGSPGALALKVAQRQELVSPFAVALAMDVLWPDDGSIADEVQVAARVRLERFVDGKTVDVAAARSAAQIAKAVVLRAGADATGEITVALQQAEALLSDLGWAIGAERSEVLRPGYRARLRSLAAALETGEDVEEALARVHQHRDGAESPAPAMAVRLHRWLTTEEVDAADFGADLDRQMSDGAWADAALGGIWNGSDDQAVAAAYQALAERVRARRHHRDEAAAARLSQTLTNGPAADPGISAIGIERVLADVVAAWHTGGVLFVVLDGLSAAIATSLAVEISRFGLVEHVPATSMRRLSVVAALPTLTNVSRASLFSGRICSGDGDAERKGLAEAFPGARTFHKEGLRSEGGASLPSEVTEAINADPNDVRVVGVVINAIDDAVHKNDVSDWTWGLSQLAPLRSLLEAAVGARRTVVVTSDHGHVVERQTEMLSAPGADSRWRADDGPVSAGEVRVSGPRVVAPGDTAILLWREDAHYGPRKAGYHGGASLAELTVPVLVFRPASATTAAPEGWAPAPPQTPEWWNDPVRVAPVPEAPKAKTRTKQAPPQDDGLFSVSEATQIPVEPSWIDLVAQVMASSTYASQRAMAGRRALPDEQVGAFLRALVARGFRAHRDTVAAAAGVPIADLGQVLAAVKRLVNVDGYDVLSVDSDGVTFKIDEALLRDQFDVGRG